MTTNKHPLLITAREAGRILGLQPGTTRKFLDERRFPIAVRKIGRNWMVRRDDIARYVDELFDRDVGQSHPKIENRGPGRPRKTA